MLILKIRKILKKNFPTIYKKTFKLRSYLFKLLSNKEKLNLVNEFFEFSPGGSGKSNQINENIIFNIKNISSSLNLLLKDSKKIRNFTDLKIDDNLSDRLKELFNDLGSDKHLHNYHLIYSHIFFNNKIKKMAEIGLGSNNEKILSSMSNFGTPGGCLRAFSKILDADAELVGLEIDETILFNENNIKTFYFDQLNLDDIHSFSKKYHNYFDLLIDDGLHSNVSMINTMYLANSVLRTNGIFVIEDIFKEQLNFLNIAFSLYRDNFEYEIYSMSETYVIIAIAK